MDQPASPALPHAAKVMELEIEVKDADALRQRRQLDDWQLGPHLEQMAYVRVYAHQRQPGWTPGIRSDFTETLYWNPALRTDAQGKASISFHCSDRLTSFRAMADALADDGGMGSADALISCDAR